METQVKLRMAQATNDRFSCTNAAVVSRSNLMKRAVLLQSVRTISSSSDERIYMQIYILTSFTTPSGIFKCKLKSNLGKKAKNCKKRHPKYSNGCMKKRFRSSWMHLFRKMATFMCNSMKCYHNILYSMPTSVLLKRGENKKKQN